MGQHEQRRQDVRVRGVQGTTVTCMSYNRPLACSAFAVLYIASMELPHAACQLSGRGQDLAHLPTNSATGCSVQCLRCCRARLVETAQSCVLHCKLIVLLCFLGTVHELQWFYNVARHSACCHVRWGCSSGRPELPGRCRAQAYWAGAQAQPLHSTACLRA